MNLIDISTNLAASLFPDETWEEQYKNVFVANSRKPKNSEQKAVFEKELLMARIASDNGHIVFLLPEIPIKKIQTHFWMQNLLNLSPFQVEKMLFLTDLGMHCIKDRMYI